MIHPTPNLLGKSALEQGVIEMFRRKIEIDGLNSVGEAFRNSAKAFKDRAIPGTEKNKTNTGSCKAWKKGPVYFLIFRQTFIQKKLYSC